MTSSGHVENSGSFPASYGPGWDNYSEPDPVKGSGLTGLAKLLWEEALFSAVGGPVTKYGGRLLGWLSKKIGGAIFARRARRMVSVADDVTPNPAPRPRPTTPRPGAGSGSSPKPPGSGRRPGRDNQPRGDVPRGKGGVPEAHPDARGPHSRLGTRIGKDGVPYRQGFTFGRNRQFLGRTDLTSHEGFRHANPHWHPWDPSTGWGPVKPPISPCDPRLWD
jgi:hypothetical protein